MNEQLADMTTQEMIDKLKELNTESDALYNEIIMNNRMNPVYKATIKDNIRLTICKYRAICTQLVLLQIKIEARLNA